SVRPHHAFGTVEVRICDAQTRGGESTALAGLIAACVAQTALDYDEHGYAGGGGPPLGGRGVQENLWRAIRYGVSGEFLDFRAGGEVGAALIGAREALARVLEWTHPARSQLGIEVDLPSQNGAERAREALASGTAIEDIYRGALEETSSTYKTDVS